MREMKSYLKYRLMRALLPTLVVSVISIVISQPYIMEYASDRHYYTSSYAGLVFFSFLLLATCFLIPIFELSELQNRRNLDTIYAFPINRSHLAATHYISGFLQIVFIYTVTFLAALPHWILSEKNYHLQYLLPFFLLSLLFAWVLYSVFSFLYLSANSIWDGIVFCLFGIFAVSCVMSIADQILREWFGRYIRELNWQMWLLYNPIQFVQYIFDHLLLYGYDIVFDNHDMTISIAESYASFWYMYLFWLVVGVATTAGFFHTVKHKRVEQIGDISTSWFGYRTMIPLCGYCWIISYPSFSYVVVLIAMLTLYFLYRRSFRLKISDILILAGTLIPNLLF